MLEFCRCSALLNEVYSFENRAKNAWIHALIVQVSDFQKQNTSTESVQFLDDMNMIIFYVLLEQDIKWPEDLKAKSEWKYTGNILSVAENGQGEVFLLRRISAPHDEAVLKLYKQIEKDKKRMRAYREMVALRAMVTGKW